jgi:hypothetical protein
MPQGICPWKNASGTSVGNVKLPKIQLNAAPPIDNKVIAIGTYFLGRYITVWKIIVATKKLVKYHNGAENSINVLFE